MTEADEIRAILRAELEPLRADVGMIRMELAVMRPNVDGIPMLRKAIAELQTQARAIRAALNDMAALHPTTGEIEALHEDVNRVQADFIELGTRLATVERRLDEMQR